MFNAVKYRRRYEIFIVHGTNISDIISAQMIFSNIYEKNLDFFLSQGKKRFWKTKSESRGRNLQNSVVIIQTKKKLNKINPQNWNSTNIFIITLLSLLQKMDKVLSIPSNGEKQQKLKVNNKIGTFWQIIQFMHTETAIHRNEFFSSLYLSESTETNKKTKDI